jgi:hypothetical protein
MLVEARLAEMVGGSFRQGSGELAARLDAELGEDLAQGVLDCAPLTYSRAPISGLDRPWRASAAVAGTEMSAMWR